MRLEITQPRALPVTMALMALVFALKTASLVRQATAQEAPGAASTADGNPKAETAAARDAAAAMPMAPKSSPKMAPNPATSSAEIPAVSPAERSLLLDLRHRRDTLEARSRELDEREALMAAAQKRLATRLAELNALQGKLQALDAARHAHDDANWTGLVHVYEAMKPREAAAIFDSLDMQVLLAVMDRMQPRKAAAVLAAMQPDRARLATQLLAELRTRATTPAGEPPIPPAPKG